MSTGPVNCATPARRDRRTVLVALASIGFALLAAGCAAPPRAPPAGDPARGPWTGRLSVRVEGSQARSFTAGFELHGTGDTGELSLSTPFGGTLARMRWHPGEAMLEADGRQTPYPSLEALTTQATGTELPIASIFRWLAGGPAQAEGWTTEVADLPQGRLVARRDQPAPAVELRLVLDR